MDHSWEFTRTDGMLGIRVRPISCIHTLTQFNTHKSYKNIYLIIYEYVILYLMKKNMEWIDNIMSAYVDQHQILALII